MSNPEQKYSDKIIESALPEIHKYFDDVTIEQVKQFGYLPPEIITALEKAQAKYNLENEIYPVSNATESKDGKTCDWCKDELVVKTSKILSSAGVSEKKVMACPNGGLKCKMNYQKNEFLTIIENSKSNIKEGDSTYTRKTRDLPVSFAKKIFLNNLEKGIKVTVQNEQLTEINFATQVEFETKEKIVKKTGKVIDFILCEHSVEKKIEKINNSKVYNLLKVEKLGYLNRLTYHTENSSCQLCYDASRKMENELVKNDLYNEAFENNAKFDVVFKHQKDIAHYRITVQRQDAELPRIILKKLENYRMNLHYEKFVLADDVLRMVTDDPEMIVTDSLKSKIVGQLKSLAKKGLIEKETFRHNFADYRQNKVDVIRAKDNTQVDRYWKNNDYVGGATELNQYRARDDTAVYLTKQAFKMMKDFKELRKNKPFPVKINGVEREWNLYESMALMELSRLIVKQLGFPEGTEYLYHKDNGRLWIACKNKIKKRKGRRL